MRVCLLTNILPPYRVAFFNELARTCDLTVILDAWLTPDRRWSVDESTVKFNFVVANGWRLNLTHAGIGYQGERRYLELANRTFPLLRRFRPDVVVSGEMGARSLQAAAYCHLHDVPLVCFWEGTPHTELRASSLRRFVRKFLASHCSAFWVNGAASHEYARTLHVPEGRIFGGMTGVDTALFRASSKSARPSRDSRRRELGLRGTVLVFSGSLSPRKGIAQYLAALTRARQLRPDESFSLLFIGDGESREDVSAWSRAHADIPVVMTGFVQTEALADLYVCGDWFVLPTLEDCWPLATLEPLICGLPQIYSVYNGATADLSRWSQTGLIADPVNTDAFARVLAEAIAQRTVVPESTIEEVASFYSPRAQAERAKLSLETITQLPDLAVHAL